MRHLLCFLMVACGGSDNPATTDSGTTAATTTETDDATGECAQPSDAPSGDDVFAGATNIVCYNAPPEGYCWESRGDWEVQTAATDGKAAIGCTDGIAVSDSSCPLDLAIGRCDGWGTYEDRVYYECNKFDAVFPEGLDVACANQGGVWTDL